MSNTHNRIRAIVSLIVCLMIAPEIVRARSKPDDAISAEINRLKNVLTSIKLPDEETKRFENLLKQMEDELRAGRLYYSLNLLQSIDEITAYQYQKSKPEIEKGGAEAFEQEWRRMGQIVAKQEKQVTAAPSARRPLIIKAMVERSLTQVGPTYKSSRLYGLNTTIAYGLLYIGMVQASLSDALFYQSLQFDETKAAPRLRSVEAELNKLEQEILEAYRKPDATDRQRLFDYANSTLKMAWDLNNEKRYAGALLQYLEATRVLGVINAPPQDIPSPDALQKQVESIRAKLLADKTDNTLAQLFLEMASAGINKAENSTDKTPLSRAAVVLNRVLAAYFDYMTGGRL